MDEEMKLLKAILIWLWRTSKPWEYDAQGPGNIYAKIQSLYSSWNNDNEIEHMYSFETRITSRPSDRYLYLRPIGSRIVPVLHIGWDQSRSIPELRLRLGLFLKEAGNEQLKAFGYRFESPETNGDHHYYHAQYIHGFTTAGPFLRMEKTWISDNCPTFPLDADSPVKLMISVLVSLYGKNFVTQIRAAVPEVENHIGQMHFFKSFPMKWYRKVTIRGQAHSETFYYRVQDPDDFQNEMQHRHAGCLIESIFPAEYDRQPPKMRLDWP